MIRIKNVVIYANRCRNSLKASSFVGNLFPRATYHLVSIIPKLVSRLTLTYLAHEIYEDISRESIANLEKVLTSRGILSMKKSVVRNDVITGLSSYVRKVKADLLVMGASSLSFIRDVVIKVIERISEVYRPLPTLICTPKTRDIGNVNEVLTILRSQEVDNMALHIASKVAYNSKAKLNIVPLIGLRHIDRIVVEKYLSTYGIRTSFINVPSKINLSKYLEELMVSSDMVVLEMRKVRKPWMKSRIILTELCKEILAKSSTPLILS